MVPDAVHQKLFTLSPLFTYILFGVVNFNWLQIYFYHGLPSQGHDVERCMEMVQQAAVSLAFQRPNQQKETSYP